MELYLLQIYKIPTKTFDQKFLKSDRTWRLKRLLYFVLYNVNFSADDYEHMPIVHVQNTDPNLGISWLLT